MHYRMLVTIAKEPGETSSDARSQAYHCLIDEPGFCGDGGRLASPIADWFVIGGRWSGCLAQTAMGRVYDTKLEAQFPKCAAEWFSVNDIKAHAEGLDALWCEFGGQGPSPFNRNNYEQEGYEDDAVALTRQLYDELLAGYAGESYAQDGGHCEFLDLDDEPLDDSFIDRKWLVVVDYHS